MKKLMSLLLALCLVVGMIPLAASASAEGSEETDSFDLSTALTTAGEGSTIEIPAGTYDVSNTVITKAVSLQGASDGETILIGPLKIAGSTTKSDPAPSISVSNITFKPAGDAASVNFGLYFGNGWNTNASMNGWTISVENCHFKDWQYAICLQGGTVNTDYTMSGNTLTVTNSTFDGVFCATSVCADSGSLDMDASSFEAAGPHYYVAQVFGDEENHNYYYSALDEEPVDVTIDTENGRPAEGFQGFDVIVLNEEGAPKSYAADINAALNAAEDGDTIYLPAGKYNIGALNNITKAVNFQGEGADKTILTGSMMYKNLTNGTEGNTITIQGISLNATDDNKHQGLCFSGQNATDGNGVNNYGINISDCAFNGWQYAIGVNGGASNNTLNVSDTSFNDTFCAMSIKESDENQIEVGQNVTTTEGLFAVQKFGSDANPNNYYHTTDDAENNTNPVSGSGSNWEVPSSWEATDGTKYGALKELVEGASEDTTIELLTNVTLDSPITLESDDNITINGNGKAITFNGVDPCKTVFTGSATGETEGIPAGVTLTVNDVTFKGENESQGYAVLMGSNAFNTNVTLTNCTFENLYSAVYNNGVFSAPEEGSENPKVSITGCTYENTTYGYSVDEVTNGAVVGAVEINDSFETSNTLNDAVVSETWNTVVATVTSGEVTKAYQTWDDAHTAANAGDTITLKKDITDPITINKAITLDGNGHTVSAETGAALTIGAQNSPMEGNITIIGGKYISTTSDGEGAGAIRIFAKGKVTVKDVATSGGIHVFNPGSYEIAGNTVSFNTRKDASVGILVFYDSLPDEMNAEDAANEILNANVISVPTSNSDYVQIATSGDDSSWKFPGQVSANNSVAMIGNSYYNTLQDAVDAVANEGIITLIKDCDENVTVSREVKFTIFIDSYTFTGSVSAGDGYKVSQTLGTYTVVKDTSTPGGGTPSTPSQPEEPEEPAMPFTDVTTGAWYYDAVEYVYENNLMAGTGATTFDPEMNLTRAMTAQILYNLEGKPEATKEATFADMNTAPNWSVDAIAWAQDTGVVAGIGNNLFDPNANVTREAFAQMMYNYAKFKGYDLTKAGDLAQFPDAGSISTWAETAMSWANGNGLINGHAESGLLDPQGTTTRAQAASIIANFDKNVVK